MEKIYSEESKLVPPKKILFIVGSTCLVAFFLFILGSTSLDSIFGFHSCDKGYWIFFSLIYITLVVLAYYAYRNVNKELKIKRDNKYNFD